MDTRSKIIAGKPASIADPVVVVTGYFDILRAEHARELQSIRERTGARTLLVIVLPAASSIVPPRARAELVAALRMVDYVVSANDADIQAMIDTFHPTEVVRLEAADERRTRQWMDDVRRRQTR